MRKFILVGNDTALATQNGDGVLLPAELMTVGEYGTDEVFDAISSASYLPRLQLFGSNSEAVKEQKIPMAHYGLVRSKDVIDDLSGVVNVLPISWRSKAMRLNEGDVQTVYNPNHPEFKKIMVESEEKDSNCLYGPEYLVWLFDQKCFATFLMGSKTARKEARLLKPLLGKPATLKVKLVSNKSYKWHAPTIQACSQAYEQSSIPSMDRLREELDRFNSPEETQVETVSVAEAEAVAGRER